MRARLLAGALVAAAALGGCSKPDLAPIPATSAPSQSARALPPATHKWSATALACPDLTGAAAARLKLTGKGTQTHASGSDDLGRTVDCRWGPADLSATSMTVKLTVAGNQAGADAGWQFTSSALVNPQPLPGVGEEAFVSDPLDGRGVQVDVRSGNANAAIHLIPATGAADGKAELREAAPELAAAAIAGLVPA
jgi:hypothetical protein